MRRLRWSVALGAVELTQLVIVRMPQGEMPNSDRAGIQPQHRQNHNLKRKYQPELQPEPRPKSLPSFLPPGPAGFRTNSSARKRKYHILCLLLSLLDRMNLICSCSASSRLLYPNAYASSHLLWRIIPRTPRMRGPS